MIAVVDGESRARQYPFVVSGEDGHSVPGALAVPDGSVAELTKCGFREGVLLRFEFLEANYIGLRCFEPGN